MYQLHESVFLIEKRLEKKLSLISPLSFSQFVILMGVSCKGSNIGGQSSLAEFLHMTEATVSRHISRLSKDDFLIKISNPANKKEKNLVLTDEGQRNFNKAQKALKHELSIIFSPLTESEQKKIMSSIALLTASLVKEE
jgi:DNA-binding MarR family transcriptional regulator